MLIGQRVTRAFVLLLLVVLGAHHPVMMAEAAPGSAAMHAGANAAPPWRALLPPAVIERAPTLQPERNTSGCACCSALDVVPSRALMERLDPAPARHGPAAWPLHDVVNGAEHARTFAPAVRADARSAVMPSPRVRRALLGVFLL